MSRSLVRSALWIAALVALVSPGASGCAPAGLAPGVDASDTADHDLADHDLAEPGTAIPEGAGGGGEGWLASPLDLSLIHI